MQPDRWARVAELFDRAAEMDPPAREAFLDEACVDDPDLRREVEAGNWDLHYRSNPIGKLILDDRFDEGHEDDPAWFSNIHHNPNANRIIAQAEFDYIMEEGLLS